jgi:pimeloyl-ACP methyl ester carboxylesterase
VLSTSSLHGFFPFRPGVATVWSQLSPDLKFIKYNYYILTAGSLLTVVGLAVLFFRGRQRLASMGLLVLAGIMLIPNDDCGNALNLPWIAWLGASPLMFLCNSVVLLIGYCALHGLCPRGSVLVMSSINAGVLLLGLGHIAQVDREANLAAVHRKFERERQRPPTSVSRIPIEGHASFYICSDARLGFKEGLPVIICIGHTFQQPETLVQFVGEFDEPVLLIWSDLLADLSQDTRLEDDIVWEAKRQEFAGVLSRYQEILRFDERRVYLTGTGFAGAYAWMLAYDRPDLYAGIVAMSAPSYPQPIQQRFDSGKSVVTVVICGEKNLKQPDREKQTGRAIEARNPHSKFMLKPGETHRDTAKYWVESLRYILQFKKEANRSVDALHAPVGDHNQAACITRGPGPASSDYAGYADVRRHSQSGLRKAGRLARIPIAGRRVSDVHGLSRLDELDLPTHPHESHHRSGTWRGDAAR